jgi:hypothetical protein
MGERVIVALQVILIVILEIVDEALKRVTSLVRK